MDGRQEFLAKVLLCKTCTKYLALSTTSPLRCTGISYNDNGEQIVNSGRLWSEIEKEHEDEQRKKLKSFYDKHKRHIDNHLAKIRG